MSTMTGAFSNEKGFTAFIKSHPLIACFFLAYAGMWAVSAPPAGISICAVNEYLRGTS